MDADWRVLLTALVGVAAGIGVGQIADRPSDSARAGALSPPDAPARSADRTEGGSETPQATTDASSVDRDRLEAALRRGREQAVELGGDVEAAVWTTDWDEPVVAGDADRRMRMWSMAKPMTALVALSEGASSEAVDGALRRSENCPQRYLAQLIQTKTGGIAPTRERLSEYWTRAGSRVELAQDAEAAAPNCSAYITRAGQDPSAEVLLLGISEWSIRDAVAFGRALGIGVFGQEGETVRREMQRDKLPSREVAPGEHTMELDFGAGKALRGFAPAYKSGWGGQQTGDFLVGQFGVAWRNGEPFSFAVMFHPSEQPSRDDPGITRGPEAIETVLRQVARAMAP